MTSTVIVTSTPSHTFGKKHPLSQTYLFSFVRYFCKFTTLWKKTVSFSEVQFLRICLIMCNTAQSLLHSLPSPHKKKISVLTKVNIIYIKIITGNLHKYTQFMTKITQMYEKKALVVTYLVWQKHIQSDVLFSILGKLWPVFCNFIIIGQKASTKQKQNQE